MTQQWLRDHEEWVAGWRAADEGGAPSSVLVWDGRAPIPHDVVVACGVEDAESARQAAQDAGVTRRTALLAAPVEDLDRGLELPGDAGLFDAPMGDHSRFEVDEWGHPVAHSTLSVRGGVAFFGPLVATDTAQREPREVFAPLVSAMANEAYLAGAERAYTVVPEEDVEAREAQGWVRAAVLLTSG